MIAATWVVVGVTILAVLWTVGVVWLVGLAITARNADRAVEGMDE